MMNQRCESSRAKMIAHFEEHEMEHAEDVRKIIEEHK